MRTGIHKILVTGGAGFIGSAFVKLLVKRRYKVVVIDNLTYAGDLKRLQEVSQGYKFYKADICDTGKIEGIFKKEKPEIVVHFAAQTHVDRSILDAGAFIQSNIMGTQILLDISRELKVKKFIHTSTDEVYGEIKNGSFLEDSPLKPNSPYAASKAAADLLIRSYIRTHNFPAIIVRPCNNYGPWQYPEKLIPFSLLKIMRNEKIPIYGNGRNIREWLFVDDCAEGIFQILEKAKLGEVYNLGSQDSRENIKTVKLIIKILKRNNSLIEFVKDRPGHDVRYSLDSKKVFQDIGWYPKITFESGLKITLHWCLAYKHWLLKKWKFISPLYKN